MRLRNRFKSVFGITFALLAILLLADTLFIYATSTPGEMFGFMLNLHGWLGLAMTIAMLAFSIPHYLQRRRHRNQKAKWLGYFLLAALFLACSMGLDILIVGRNSTPLWIVRGHELLFGVSLVAFLTHRLSAVATPMWRYELTGVIAGAGLFLGFWIVNSQIIGGVKNENNLPVANLTSTEFRATPATTITGHTLNKSDLANSDYCAQCHFEVAQQWAGSAHRFSSFNDPFYEKTATILQQNREPVSQQFCGGCHDPLVLLTGNMNQEVTRSTTNAQEGITCLMCHSVVEIKDRLGNAGYVVAAPDHYPYFGSDDPNEQKLNLK
ncbi:MAG: multiheme c-type cytochrome [Pirellulaceae bacterium]